MVTLTIKKFSPYKKLENTFEIEIGKKEIDQLYTLVDYIEKKQDEYERAKEERDWQKPQA